MMDMVKVFEDVVKWLARKYLFCFAQRFALYYEAFALKQKEAQDSIKEAHGEGGSHSEESISAELQPVFVIGNSTLHYFSAVGNDSQISAAELGAHMSMIENTFHFWRSGASLGVLLDHANYRTHENLVTN